MRLYKIIALVGCISIFFVLVIFLSSLDWSSRINDGWIAPPPDVKQVRELGKIQKDRIFFPTQEFNQELANKLSGKEYVELSNTEIHKYWPENLSSQSHLTPYLVRCVSYANPKSECSIRMSPDILWISCEVLTHSRIFHVKHTPVIIMLNSPPKKVYVSFSAAG